MSRESTSKVNSVPGDKTDIDLKLAKYKQDNQPKGSRLSKLDPVKSYILLLHSDGYSHDQIAAFIQIIGIEAHSTTIGRYIRKCSSSSKTVLEKEQPKSEISSASLQTKIPGPQQSRGLANLDTLSRPTEKTATYKPYQGITGDKE